MSEPRVGGLSVIQRFFLGGFGFGPFELSRLVANTPIGEGLSFDERTCSPPQLTEFCVSNEAARRRFHCENFAVCAENDAAAEHSWVRAFYLSTPTSAADRGTEVVFLSLDAIGAGNVILDDLKAAIRLSVPTLAPENIVIGMTHSHAGADLQGLWGGVPQDWVQNILQQAAVNAVLLARNSAEKAEVTFATGKDAAFNNYRRPRYQEDTDDADPQLSVLQAKVAGSPRVLGTLVQYSAHPTSIGTDSGEDAGRAPHPDYPLGLEDAVEEATSGAPAVYFNGPIADASPSGGPGGSDDYEAVHNRGDCLAHSALAILQNNPAGVCSSQLQIERQLVLAPALTVRAVTAQLPITNPLFLVVGAGLQFNRYYDFQPFSLGDIPGIGPELAAQQDNLPQVVFVANTLVNRVTLGSGGATAEIVTIPGEATNTFGQYIRRLAHDRAGTDNVMLLGLTQNSFGYILPEEEFNYIDPSGDAGFVLPFTGYEEFVSLGPLTAPLLRVQAYNPLFGVPPEDPANLPPTLTECAADPGDPDCIVPNLLARVDYIQRSYAQVCRDNGAPAEFCALLDPQTPLAQPCRDAGLPEDLCDMFGDGAGGTASDADLLLPALDAQLRGCDLLDPAHCLLPFPNDHFTVVASAGSPQSVEEGGTGRRINFNPLAMPRNVAGKPIDPTEWNRNDGYSPGQMIVTYVPGLAANADGTIAGAPPITDPGQSLNVENSPVLVLDAATGTPHPVWAEIDLNAGMLLYVPGREFGAEDTVVPNPKPKQAALIIRPAVNFRESHRYVVVLKNLRNAAGELIPAGPAFTVCRDRLDSALPPVQQRCEALEQDVFSVLDADLRNDQLFLAWDFTVAGTNNTIGRLRHMRDDAFVNYLGQQEDDSGAIVNLGRAPAFEVTEVNDYPADHGQLVREIKGTFTVPSYVVPMDPSPLDGQAEFRRRINELPPEIQEQIEDGPLFAPIEISLPPNRLFYLPDETSATACDPASPEDGLQGRCFEQARFGDGLPDRTGEMTTTFTCRIAKKTLNNNRFPAEGVPPSEAATAADVKPARPSLYGHGLLGDHGEINQDQLRRFGNEHNMMFCATDWFGFASGDLPNVLSLTLDMSNFPVLPDGTQQGILNQMFLARLLRHPQGFASHSAFRAGDTPVFDTREVFYDGNSQGGITGGAVVAASKDINRGSLGVPGMNYSTLLTRSVDFDIFSVPLYASYPDDLDRDLIFSMIQMLWDRSENNGYALHMTDNSAFKGPDNEILLHPAFGDHQVTMWSADVMARTIGANADRSRIAPARREPVGFNNAELGMALLDYANADHAAGSGLVYWDEPWPDTEGDNCFDEDSGASQSTPPPPVGNVPPRTGSDPHECPRRQVAARCQKSHFLHSQGRLIGARNVASPTDCPPLPLVVPLVSVVVPLP